MKSTVKKRFEYRAAILSVAALMTAGVPLFCRNAKLTAEEKTALQAKREQLEQEVIGLKAKDQTDAAVAEELAAKETELQAANAEWDANELRERNEVLEASLLTQRTKDADDAVKAAVKRGAIPAKDEALQAKWKLVQEAPVPAA